MANGFKICSHSHFRASLGHWQGTRTVRTCKFYCYSATPPPWGMWPFEAQGCCALQKGWPKMSHTAHFFTPKWGIPKAVGFKTNIVTFWTLWGHSVSSSKDTPHCMTTTVDMGLVCFCFEEPWVCCDLSLSCFPCSVHTWKIGTPILIVWSFVSLLRKQYFPNYPTPCQVLQFYVRFQWV